MEGGALGMKQNQQTEKPECGPTVAFIPVRGGSKSIPLKNIKPIAGKPLVYWTARAACMCAAIDIVYVATDSGQIRAVVESFSRGAEAVLFQKLRVIGRSAESASDTASTEAAMLEFAETHDFDTIALIQATSPLLQGTDLDRGFAAYSEEGTDSVLSVVPQKRFNWAVDEHGFAHPTNYDVFHRPRRQEFGGYLVENGAFYITSRERLLTTRNRVSGNIRAVEMSEDSFLEIDEPADWFVIETLMNKKDGAARPEIPEIRLFLTDCDGCLTDGGMYYSEHGDEMKKFNTRDGMAFAMLREHGILTGIITNERVELTRRRAEKLKLDFYEAGCNDKTAAIRKLCTQQGIAPENVAYIGDDINDLEAIRMVGLGCCPADALSAVQSNARLVTSAKGGAGVIREVADYILSGSNGGCIRD